MKKENILYIFGAILVLGMIAFYIYIWVRYGNVPREEVPNWVWWIMWRR